MYCDFYGLSGMPFQLTPDERFFFDSEQHRKALAFLQYGISQAEGFVVITGEVGAGKTTLVEHLLATLEPSQYLSGRIVTTQLGSYDMLRMIGAALNVFREGMDKAALLVRIGRLFSDMRGQNKRVLLIVDEAQSLSAEAVEELRMLSNIAISGAPPFQGILLGQPEFRAVLATAGLEQFRQRVIASYHLGALNPQDTRGYIEHRLSHVGWKGDPAFTDGAFGEIYRQTSGVPRRINMLCSRLLLLGFLDGAHEVTEAMAANIGEELTAEVGPAVPGAGLRAATDLAGRGTPVRDEAAASLGARITHIEEKLDRHDKAINRAFDIALRHLPTLREN